MIFFASYFAEKKELLSIPTARVGDRLVVDPRALLPILLAWGLAMMVIGVENDIGFALLIFTCSSPCWVTTGRSAYLSSGGPLRRRGLRRLPRLPPRRRPRHAVAEPQAPYSSVQGE